MVSCLHIVVLFLFVVCFECSLFFHVSHKGQKTPDTAKTNKNRNEEKRDKCFSINAIVFIFWGVGFKNANVC